MRADNQSGSRRAHLLGIVTALMCALAAGALWCVLALYSGRDLAVLALPSAAVIGWSLRSRRRSRALDTMVAAICTAIACAYAQYLLAAAKVAALLGLPMRKTLFDIGAGLAGDVAWASIDAADWLIFALALFLAAWLVWRRPEPQHTSES
ncbi:MAG: hypothetical protein WB784_07160 [Rhodanobacteraceae bacterium]